MGEEATLPLIERLQWLEPVETELQKGVGRAFETVPGGRQVKNFLYGTWLGHPLHPVLTDIPIGAWTTAVVLDAVDSYGGGGRYGRAADTALTVGLTGAAASAATGLTDWQATDGGARRVGLAHAAANSTATVLMAASLILRKRRQRAAGRLCALLGYAVALGAAYLGGHLVFVRRIGVNHAPDESMPAEFVPVLAADELGEGEFRRVEANGSRVLLLRRDGVIHAIGEVCSHLGGPLAEGEVQGNTVRCPWHGSRFSVQDGRVVDGPATHPQPCLEARVRDGQIEVRLRPTERE